MTENANMKLWDQVSKTNPKHTKQVKQRGGFTAVCAQSRIKRATELWGPMGCKWGVNDPVFTINEPFKVCLYSAMLYYPLEGQEVGGMLPINSSIAITASNGKLDEDFVKKVSTDALTKGLSRLGFSSDVFEGLYDDNKYVAALKEEFSEKAPVKPVTVAPDLPPLNSVNITSMNMIAKWVKENTKNGKNIPPAELAKSVYAVLGHWPETPADEKLILENLSIEKVAG